MVTFEKTMVDGWEAAIRGMRNPLNSWDRSDSGFIAVTDDAVLGYDPVRKFVIGKNDYDLMKRLIKSGPEHAKFLRMINVTVDITAPLYFWKELDTYKVGTVRNSCSTMHKIASKEFTLDDFSHEHLEDLYYEDGDTACDNFHFLDSLKAMIFYLNCARKMYIETKDKRYWWQMIQLLPSSYNQKATMQFSYAVLANIYKQRKNHKLDEWSIGFIDWIKTLPYSEFITGEFE